MPRYMLSFDRGIPIAHGIDKSGKKILTIHITEEKDKPDIQVDRVEELIDEADYELIKKMMRLSVMEIKLLKKFIKSNGNIDTLADRLRLALSNLREIATSKLKRKILFNKSDEISSVIPFIGSDLVPYDRSIFLTGPSGSGKSFLAKEIMKHDEKKRPIIVFSKVDDDDSLKELKKLKINGSSFSEHRDGGLRFIKIRLQTEDDLLNLPSNDQLKNCICLFDDIDSFPKDISDFLAAYRDSILECGRHHNITVLSTSHQLFNWTKTRTILNESLLVCMFPHSNKRNAMIFLKDRMGLSRPEYERILEESMDCGRSLMCRLSAPNCIIHEKGVEIL